MQLISCLVPVRTEIEEKSVPPELMPFSSRRGIGYRYTRAIEGSMTGETIAYEQFDGNWIIDDRKLERNYKALKELHKPTKIPDNVRVTAYGIFTEDESGNWK